MADELKAAVGEVQAESELLRLQRRAERCGRRAAHLPPRILQRRRPHHIFDLILSPRPPAKLPPGRLDFIQQCAAMDADLAALRDAAVTAACSGGEA
jgi:hypothetical protein